MPEFPSMTHLAVTVTDLDRSTRWYTALFAADPVLDEDVAAGGGDDGEWLEASGRRSLRLRSSRQDRQGAESERDDAG